MKQEWLIRIVPFVILGTCPAWYPGIRDRLEPFDYARLDRLKNIRECEHGKAVRPCYQKLVECGVVQTLSQLTDRDGHSIIDSASYRTNGAKILIELEGRGGMIVKFNPGRLGEFFP